MSTTSWAILGLEFNSRTIPPVYRTTPNGMIPPAPARVPKWRCSVPLASILGVEPTDLKQESKMASGLGFLINQSQEKKGNI